MGLEAAAIVAAVATVGKMGFEAEAAAERERALSLEAEQLKVATQQKTLNNFDVMEKVVAAQTAHQTTTGTSFASPSFNAIQRETINAGAREARNIETEGNIAEENLEAEKRNVKNTLFAQLFGDTASAAFTAAGVYNKMPKSGSTGVK